MSSLTPAETARLKFAEFKAGQLVSFKSDKVFLEYLHDMSLSYKMNFYIVSYVDARPHQFQLTHSDIEVTTEQLYLVIKTEEQIDSSRYIALLTSRGTVIYIHEMDIYDVDWSVAVAKSGSEDCSVYWTSVLNVII